MSNQNLIVSSNGMLLLPAIEEIAKRYGLDAAAFAYTFRAVAMPQPHSEPEFVSCVLVAREHQLNPLTKEIYFMRTKQGVIQPIVSVDGWIKKCNEHPQYDGMEITDVRDDKGSIIAMTVSIFRKDRSRPTTVTEDMDECRASGGPVWQKSPKRMLRNRTICQGARLAFGFAGIMERDEFDQWQAMKDVTPTPALAATASQGVPEVPEVPDVPAVAAQEAAPSDDDVLSEDQQAALIEKIREDLALCKTNDERAEVADSYSDILDRLSDVNRRKADRLFEGR